MTNAPMIVVLFIMLARRVSGRIVNGAAAKLPKAEVHRG